MQNQDLMLLRMAWIGRLRKEETDVERESHATWWDEFSFWLCFLGFYMFDDPTGFIFSIHFVSLVAADTIW